MMHRCPGPECSRMITHRVLACPRHWYQVPPAIRQAVKHAWRNGAGAGSAAHEAAIDAAINAMRPL